MEIRAAVEQDLPELVRIRNCYVEPSNATFNTVAHTVASLTPWLARFAHTGPHRLLVAAEPGTLLGHCSSQSYRPGPAFALTVETSVYVDPERTASGVGKGLYAELFERLKDESLHRAVVGIALPNDASVRLHEKFGFREIGVFDEYAIKNGQFISSVWMQKSL